jgi:hypothetical protein
MTVVRYAPCLVPFLLFAACSSRDDESHGVDDGNGGASNGGTIGVGGTGTAGTIPVVGGTGAAGASGAGPMGPCTGLRCNQTTCTQGPCTQMPCAGTTRTTVSGIVRDPAGKVPLYNVTVYVPNGTVPPIVTGATCDRCDQTIVSPVTSTLTDETGHFSLPDAPVGENIPLVIQIGKWRRQLTIPAIPRCVDTPVMDVEQTSLPSKKSEGDIPLIAITTGGADSMECLPLRMGIEPQEFTTEAGDGRIHLYAGTDSGMSTATTALDSGMALTHSDELWSNADALRAYDIVILSCEGDSNENQRPNGARQAVYDYTEDGGRLFASHWHHRWISEGPNPFPAVGTWNDRDNPETPTTATINTGFPKGAALAQWLVNVGASMTVGQMEVLEARDNVQAVNTMYATEWMSVVNENENDSEAVEYLSFNTPPDAAETMKCGRVVYTDLHVSNTTDMNNTSDTPGDPFPGHCQMRDLTAQEKAVEFMLFDLSACIQDDTTEPEPPR